MQHAEKMHGEQWQNRKRNRRQFREQFFGFVFAIGNSMLEKFTAYQLAKQFYWACKALKVPRFLQDQLLRASSSVALNLSEASGRRTEADQRKHYSIAFGSLQECRTILELEKIDNPGLLELADQLAAILYTLSRKKISTKSFTDN
jgi:four helix bundle protein